MRDDNGTEILRAIDAPIALSLSSFVAGTGTASGKSLFIRGYASEHNCANVGSTRILEGHSPNLI